ncbi:Na+/H+ antiporter subunit B [Qingshengfaniella alkalisoli]|uniref:Na+/H+ antiporter subunit B n=1 Tax=Qingshengfaniella alkalisoli TaxID=2599296 RepID=A0A5B8IA62_9RHOB|nr:Na+/H+ antiporter subunit B [Qingshengfaniella alkalisoli]QDY70076.1 Na+/H+ antiporter subunit B [Qingshengfaniella alkalisoli]
MKSIILQAASQILVALLLVFSVYMLLRGHNAPGGGFIGGLIGATGFVLHAIACGTEQTRAALRLKPENLAIIGLAMSLLAGLISLPFGDPLLTGQWLFLGASEGEKGLPISTILLFDIGVYFVVLGAALTIVMALEEEV